MGRKRQTYVDIMALHPGVTGSCKLMVVKYPNGDTTRFIVDCGLFQEKEYAKYNESFPFDAMNIKFCLITHCHVDHIGRLPLLVRKGFRGKIYTTEGTESFLTPVLYDSCHVLGDVAKRNHVKPPYTENDVVNTLALVESYEFEKTIQIDSNIKVTFFTNGHLIGAAIILVQISYPESEDLNLLFTGDYNNKNAFFDVPKLPEWVLDLPITIVQESTYGTMESSEMHPSFENNIRMCMARGGTAVCMVFSLGRSQEILYVLKKMQENGRLNTNIPIYFDGKLAHRYTDMYLKREVGIREDMKDFLPENLIYVDKATRPSVAADWGQKIIVTTSGMGTYGPAQVYIPEYIVRKKCLLQFTGYTAEGTLGSELKDTKFGETVAIGSIIRKKWADVEYTTEFSAHAKADEMIAFLKQFRQLKLVLVNHGEPDTKLKFSERIVDEVDPKCVAILNRDYFFRIDPYGLIRPLSTHFD